MIHQSLEIVHIVLICFYVRLSSYHLNMLVEIVFNIVALKSVCTFILPEYECLVERR